MPSAQAMVQRWLVPQDLKNGWGCATREQGSDAERDCLVQRKRKAGLKPAPYTGEESNVDPKGCGGWVESTQEFVEKVDGGGESAHKDRRKQGVNREKRGCKP